MKNHIRIVGYFIQICHYDVNSKVLSSAQDARTQMTIFRNYSNS